MRDDEIIMPEDPLDCWTEQNSPYGAAFAPSVVFGALRDTVGNYPDPSAFSQRAWNDPNGPVTQAASRIWQVYWAHRDLLCGWVARHSTDAILATPPSLNQVATRDYVCRETLSIALAGRMPCILTPPLRAFELEGSTGDVENSIELPIALLAAVQDFAPLLMANRCVVLPMDLEVESCMLSVYGETGTLVARLSDALGDLAAHEYTAIEQVAGKRLRDTISILTKRPILGFLGGRKDHVDLVEEHAESYAIYRANVANLALKIQSSSSEAEVRSALLAFEASVAEVEARYRAMEKKLRRHGMEAVAGLASTIVCLAVPQVPDFVRQLVASTSVWDGFSYIRSRADARDEIEADPYWFPWYSRKNV